MDQSIYFDSLGRNILNPTNYPKGVQEYLNDEKEFIKSLMYNHGGLIEVGCFDATYSLLCDSLSKLYIGIDIVPEYVEEANHRLDFWSLDSERFEILNLDAHLIAQIPEKSKLIKNLPAKEWLIVFPFNCLGNLPYPQKVIDGIKSLKINSFFSTFKVSKKSTLIRKEYYSNCKISGLKATPMNTGLCFSSGNKFSSVAYSNTWIFNNLFGLSKNSYCFNLGDIGIAVLNTLNKIKEMEMPSFNI